MSHQEHNEGQKEGADEAELFADPGLRSDCCPICTLTFGGNEGGEMDYMACCGSILCYGCTYSMMIANSRVQIDCPFCRNPGTHVAKERRKLLTERIQKYNDAEAMVRLGEHYIYHKYHSTGIELYQHASQLGSAKAHYLLAVEEKDPKKEVDHLKKAAMMGNRYARYKLGCFEVNHGSMEQAMKHFLIGAKCGDDNSLESLMFGYRNDIVAKDDLESALRAHQAVKDETKSDQREAYEQLLIAKNMMPFGTPWGL